jgi:hypothetical protein
MKRNLHVLYERRTEVISPEMESGTGSDFIFHELRAVLQEILERSKALCGTIEAFGISISIPSEPGLWARTSTPPWDFPSSVTTPSHSFTVVGRTARFTSTSQLPKNVYAGDRRGRS